MCNRVFLLHYNNLYSTVLYLGWNSCNNTFGLVYGFKETPAIVMSAISTKDKEKNDDDDDDDDCFDYHQYSIQN